jgi:glutathione synthase/RimK-type ligase-like ATP-grasp enzyme
VCLRSTWDYHLRWPAFRTWVEAFRSFPGSLWNPPDTVLWNADKMYLRELDAAGVAIPPTAWFEPGQSADWRVLFDLWDAPRVVVKPRISATAYGTHLLTRGATLTPEQWEVLQAHGFLIQAYIPAIERNGEVSLVFIAGRFSHAVRKQSAPGDFRVQRDFGGTIEPDPSADRLIPFAAAVLERVSTPWIYARVDVVDTETGPLLMELELIEPDLFLSHGPGGAALLAEALLGRAA